MRQATAALAGGALLVGLLAGAASAQQMFVYPQKGQDAQQQAKDEGECIAWARQQTGFDPMSASAPRVGESQDESVGRGAVGGAARGALGGAIVGAIAGDAGKGAAIGAAGGGLFGGMRTRDQNNQQRRAAQGQAEQQAAQQNAARANFNRAYAACMEGRGYQVR